MVIKTAVLGVATTEIITIERKKTSNKIPRKNNDRQTEIIAGMLITYGRTHEK